MSAASATNRIVVSRDGDFATLLALGAASQPSFIHLRIPGVNRPDAQAALVLRALEIAGADLAAGAIVTVRGDKIRVRALPVGKP